jgi:hypothetical protein
VSPGPAPKRREARQRRNAPALGEWRVIAALNPEPPPLLPAGTWTERSRERWHAWWAEGVSVTWGPGDLAGLPVLLQLHEAYDVAGGPLSLLTEARARESALGLTPAGRSRLRIAYEEDHDADS